MNFNSYVVDDSLQIDDKNTEISVMNNRIAFLVCLIAALPPFAYASEPAPPVCPPIAELSKEVRDCSQNHFYTLAALHCLDKLEREIDAKKASLALLMTASSAAAGSAQAARLENNGQNISDLLGAIDNLTERAERARKEIIVYSENFVYAGPISKSMAEKLRMVRYLSMFDCYAVSRSGLGKVVQILDGHLAEFRKVTASARPLLARTAAAVRKVDSSSVNAPVSNRAPASAGAPVYAAPPPKAKQGPSDISGTDKIGESNRALQKLTK